MNGNRGAPKHPIHGARGVSGYINVYASAYAFGLMPQDPGHGTRNARGVLL